MKEKTYVLCVLKKDRGHPDSVSTNCVLCSVELSIMPHNLDKNPICVKCLPEIKAAYGGLDMMVAEKDLKAALDYATLWAMKQKMRRGI